MDPNAAYMQNALQAICSIADCNISAEERISYLMHIQDTVAVKLEIIRAAGQEKAGG